ncbi:MAG: hypothetical protein M1812_000329 [Candelaria pacifica]|nr:MAG: hypothetical protein M1812_000329 [Candelaria pacifica]
MPGLVFHAAFKNAVARKAVNGVQIRSIVANPVSKVSPGSSSELQTSSAICGDRSFSRSCSSKTRSTRFITGLNQQLRQSSLLTREETHQDYQTENHDATLSSCSYEVEKVSRNTSRLPNPARERRSTEIRSRRRLIPNVRTSKKRGSASPSLVLVAALETIGLHQAIPKKFPNKFDLSLVSPAKADVHSQLRPKSHEAEHIGASEGSLQTILSIYLVHLFNATSSQGPMWDSQAHGSFDKALSSVFSDKALSYLDQRGFNAEDVMAWAWILTAESAKRATLRLINITNGSSIPPRMGPRSVPTFVFLFLLRREDINAQTLKCLLEHAWDRLHNRCLMRKSTSGQGSSTGVTRSAVDLTHKEDSPYINLNFYVQMNESTILTMVVRLLRHARKVWPSASVSIIAMVTAHIDGTGSSDIGSKIPPETSTRLTFVYNRMLALLAQPSPLHPFLSMSYHQRAQFDLLKRMADFNPPLCISREGYRAVTKVQVAHKKTVEERQWAEMKAKSWPPWKEEKLGLDVVDVVEQGRSRALESMTRMKEAGYSGGRWEKVATIVSGWDTDMSPTIQTRTILDMSVSSQADRSRLPPDSKHPPAKNEESRAIWATRIRATRTVYEAWACFLAHGDSGFRSSEAIYAAMFEKLVLEGTRKRRSASTEARDATTAASDSARIYPGDGKEVDQAPVSPQEAVYVRCEPPSLEELFLQMTKEGIKPSNRSLAFLVSRASSIRAGLRFLRLSGIQGASALADYGIDSQADLIRELCCVSDQVFAAFIQLLCRFNQPSFHQEKVHRKSITGATLIPIRNLSSPTKSRFNPIMHALRLVDIRRPRYRPCWNALLSAFARPSGDVRNMLVDTENLPREIFCWNSIQKIVQHMQQVGMNLDWDGFQKVCIGLEKATLASTRFIRDLDRTKNDNDPTASRDEVAGSTALRSRAGRESDVVLKTGHSVVKSHFRELVGANLSSAKSEQRAQSWEAFDTFDSSCLMPTLLVVPNPSHLHAYIRVLGVSRDYEGILVLIQWMAKYSTELFAVANAASSGKKIFRRTLVSARVFLERNWETNWQYGKEDSHECCASSLPQEVISKVKETINSVESWGGWPEDDEVAFYLGRETPPNNIRVAYQQSVM